MTIFYKAILPKRDPAPKIKLQRAVSLMRQFGNDALQELKIYPPKPPESRYQRTGDLSRAWRKFGPKIQNGNIEMDIFNDVEDKYGRMYMPFVQGPRRFQLSRFRRQGWFSVLNVNTQIWPRYRYRIVRSLGISERRATRVFVE